MSSVDYLAVLNSLARVGAANNRYGQQSMSEALSTLVAGVGQALEGAEVSLYGCLTEASQPALLIGEGGADQQALAEVLQGESASYQGELASFPLVVAERPIGVLEVKHAGGFTPLDKAVLANYANQAATLLHHRVVQKDLERREEDLDQLRRSGLLISSRMGLGDTLEAILEMALEVTNARYGIFRLLNRENQLVTRAVAGEGMEHPLIEALSPEPTSVTGWVAHHRKSVCIRDLREQPWSDLYYPLDEDLEMRSEVAVPLVDGSGRLEGVLNLESPDAGAFSNQDRLLLQGLATQAIIAIGQARLLDILQKVSSRLLSLPCAEVLVGLADRAETLANVTAGIWLLESGVPVLVAGRELSLDGDFFKIALGSQEAPVGWFVADCNDGWQAKVVSSLAHYATLALDNDRRQRDLVLAQEQRAVAESFAAVGDLSANLLHRLNNKVGIIPVRVDGIRDRCSGLLAEEPYLSKNLNAIEESARQAMKVVADNFSLLAPAQGGGQNLEQVLASAVDEVGIPESVSLETQGLDQLPPVLAEEHGLRLIFANLLENSVKAMGGEGCISVCGDLTENWIEVVVADNGPGVLPEVRERIFEPRFSEGSSGGKLGFGLWWVRTLMARLGGTIKVADDKQVGARFLLRFPRRGFEESLS